MGSHIINGDSYDIIGFSYEHGGSLIGRLNRAYLEKIEGLDTSRIKMLGQDVNENCQAIFEFETKDNYRWKTGLIFDLDKEGKLAVLFPWLKEGNKLERDVGVYSTEDLEDATLREYVDGLVRGFEGLEVKPRIRAASVEQ